MLGLDVAGHLHINQENGLPVGPVAKAPGFLDSQRRGGYKNLRP